MASSPRKISPQLPLSNQEISICPPSVSRMYLISVAVIALYIVLHLFAIFYPSAGNWGFHHLAFLPMYFKIGTPAMMILLMIPSVQMWLIQKIENVVSSYKKQGKTKKLLLATLGTVSLGVIFWICRERFFLLGDGSLVTRIIQKGLTGDLDVATFKNEPLSGYILLKVGQLISTLAISKSGEFPIQIISILFGTGSILVIVQLVKYLAESSMDRVLTALFIITMGSIQLFFGYVEVYTVLFFGLLFYFWLVLAVLHGDIHIVIPSMMYGILFTLHFGTLCFIPTLLYLFILNIRGGQWLKVLTSTVVMCLVVLGTLWMCGISSDIFFNLFSKGGKHVLTFSESTNFYQPYSFFSIAHVIDFANIQCLLSPLALLLVCAMFIKRSSLQPDRNLHVFVFLAASCSLSFILLFNTEIGMSRDWDIFAAFNLGGIIAAAYAINYLNNNVFLKRRLVVMVAGVTMLHSIGFISVNADERLAIERFKILSNQNLWSRSAITSAYEELGIYYRSQMKADSAVKYFKKFLEVDSTNSRIWGSLAHVYSLTGDRMNELRNNEKAIEVGTTNPDIYLNTGIAYASIKKYDEAIITLEKALELNPELAGAYHTLGVVYLQGKDNIQEALKNFLTALEIDPNHADSYLGSGNCYFQMKKINEARIYWQKFLSLGPDDPNAPKIRNILQALE